MEAERKEIPQDLIRFGDVFWTETCKGRPETKHKEVVIGIEETYFHSAVILDLPNIEALHPWSGSTVPEQVIEIVDNWSLERINKALIKGTEQIWKSPLDNEVLDSFLNYLKKQSVKKPIKVIKKQTNSSCNL